jgi:hypothetical protein
MIVKIICLKWRLKNNSDFTLEIMKNFDVKSYTCRANPKLNPKFCFQTARRGLHFLKITTHWLNALRYSYNFPIIWNYNKYKKACFRNEIKKPRFRVHAYLFLQWELYYFQYIYIYIYIYIYTYYNDKPLFTGSLPVTTWINTAT